MSRRMFGRLSSGAVRTLTTSEFQRGYFFICNDKRLPQILDTDDFDVDFMGKEFSSKKIDASGRIYIGRDILSNKCPGIKIRISLISRRKIRIDMI